MKEGVEGGGSTVWKGKILWQAQLARVDLWCQNDFIYVWMAVLSSGWHRLSAALTCFFHPSPCPLGVPSPPAQTLESRKRPVNRRSLLQYPIM